MLSYAPEGKPKGDRVLHDFGPAHRLIMSSGINDSAR
jgi:hypothetical protein